MSHLTESVLFPTYSNGNNIKQIEYVPKNQVVLLVLHSSLRDKVLHDSHKHHADMNVKHFPLRNIDQTQNGTLAHTTSVVLSNVVQRLL